MTERNHGRHRSASRPSASHRKIAVGLLAAAVVGSAAATAWAVSTVGSPAGDEPATKPTASPAAESPTGELTSEHSTATSPAAEPEPTTPPELVACEEAVSAAEDTIAAARSGIKHWTEHVNARTDLVDGDIMLDDTNAIFARTRQAGPKDIETFDDARDTYAGVEGACANVSRTHAAREVTDHAEACLARADAAAAAVSTAADVIDDWRSHLAAMRAHAGGDMTSTMARDQWIEAWRSAPPALEAFADRAADLDAAPACA